MVVLRTLVAMSMLLVPSLANADVIQPDENACEGKQLGDECSYQEEDWGGGASASASGPNEPVMGACECSTCSEADYSQGTPPTYKDVPCLRCVPGSMVGATSSCGTGTGSGTDAEQPAGEDEAKGCSGCAVDRTSLWSLGLGLGLLAFLRRGRASRRRRVRAS